MTQGLFRPKCVEALARRGFSFFRRGEEVEKADKINPVILRMEYKENYQAHYTTARKRRQSDNETKKTVKYVRF
jgi:hypothetical protein